MARYYFLIGGWLLAGAVALTAQSNCPTPPQLLSIAVNNTTCGQATGTILLNTAGGPYEYTWLPNVSSGAAATGLPAGGYFVTITRTGQPECTLDTLVVVTNTDGPTVQIASVTPSNCLASNGVAELLPASLSYAWSNGEVGNLNTGLNSGCYAVTATDPNSGCSSVLAVCVPNVNPLQATASVTYPSKCSRPTGSITTTVSGGSGVYSYSLGGTVVNGLPPGPGFGLVVDNTTGCLDTAFFNIPIVFATANVSINASPARCADGLGGVSLSVEPGDNFKSPFTFAITDLGGEPQSSAGGLPVGTYLLYVSDADSCSLQPIQFSIGAPAPLTVNLTTTPGTCTDGAQISTQISGGVGTYLTDWSDLPGFINPASRQHLPPGRYTLVVYDSLFCTDTVANILVNATCAGQIDTFRLLVRTGDNGTFCLPQPTGLTLAEQTYTLVEPVATSTFGSWNLAGNCLNYNALQTPGFDVDVVCIRRQIPALGITDTVCVAVSILPNPISTETVYPTVQVNSSVLACGNIPPEIAQKTVLPLNIPSLNGVDLFGTYSISPTNACLTFGAFDLTGFNVDTLAVAVCDLGLQRCHQLSFVPSVLPFADCSGGVLDADSLFLPTSVCEAGAATCLDIPYANLLNFNILDNNAPYTQGALGCNEGMVVSYALDFFPNNLSLTGGPYHLDNWTIDGEPQNGNFSNLEELLVLLNQLDPTPGWYLENFLNIIGGDPAKTYGPLRVALPSGSVVSSPKTVKKAPLGSSLRFTTGEHTVIFRKIQTGCTDTLHVTVQCFDCPPVHNYPLDIFGNIEWQAPACAADTVFCTNIPAAELANWVITDQFVPFTNFQNCGSNVGFRFDTGYHEMRLRNTLTTCEYSIKFFFDCRKAPVDTIFGTVRVGQTVSLCPDTTLLPSPIITIFNICPERAAEPNATLTYDEQNWCALVTGTAVGQDTFCLQLCNADGQCVTVLALLNVVPNDGDKVLVYNGISPNGDQRNDTWVIEGLALYPEHQVQVFNRWGNLVFESTNYQNDWDGTWRGQPLPVGTYYYVIDLGGGEGRVSGYLELLR